MNRILDITELEKKTKEIRKGIIEEVYSHSSGHPGGSRTNIRKGSPAGEPFFGGKRYE